MKRLQTKLALRFAGVLLVALPTAGLLTLMFVSRELDEDLEHRAEATSRGVEMALSLRAKNLHHRALSLTRDPELIDAVSSADRVALLRITENVVKLLDVSLVTVIDREGRVLARGHAPTRYGDVRTTIFDSARAIVRSESGLAIGVVVPIGPPHRSTASLVLEMPLDHRLLERLKRQFGVDFALWNGPHLQATTLDASDIIQALRPSVAKTPTTFRQLETSPPLLLSTLELLPEAPTGQLFILTSRRSVRSIMATLTGSFVIVTILLFLLFAALAVRGARGVVEPVARLAAVADAVARGKLDTRVDVDTDDEIGQLAKSFRVMLQRRLEDETALRRAHDELEEKVEQRTRDLREREEQLRHAEKMRAVGLLAGGIAHDFNNMLAVIQGNAELLQLEADGLTEDQHVQLADLLAAAGHAAALTRQLLDFSRPQSTTSVLLDLSTTLQEAERMLRRVIGEDIELSCEAALGVPRIRIDPDQLKQVLVNLAANARDAMPDGGKLTMRVTAGRGSAIISVADTGVGMSADVRARIFEPFFTTKGIGEGTGMGLATVYGIVEKAGGTIDIDSAPGQGSTFTIELPAAASGLVTRTEAEPAHATSGHETILLVEDDEGVRRTTTRLLSLKGFQVYEAASPEQALSLLAQRQEPIHVVLTDVIMPGMNGKQLIERVRALQPNLPAVFMSGYAAEVISRETLEALGCELVSKPISIDALALAIRRTIDRASQAAARSDGPSAGAIDGRVRGESAQR